MKESSSARDPRRNILGFILTFVLGIVVTNLFNRVTFWESAKSIASEASNPNSFRETSFVVKSQQLDTRIQCKVVIFVPSSIDSVQRRFYVNRQFISENWAAEEVQLVWIIGTRAGPMLESSLNTSVIFQEPYMTSQNTLLVNCRDKGDEYNNPNGTSSTTCKFYEAMRHIHKHFKPEYVIRGADDAYLNVKQFLKLAPTFSTKRLWLGQKRRSIGGDPDLDLNNQPKLKELFGFRYFSNNYMLGMGSVFSADIAELIGGWNIDPHLTWCEDVLVGMWLSLFQIQHVDRPDLFVNRAGSSGNSWPMDGTYGNLTVIFVHYMLPSDWDYIYNNEEGKIFISCKGQHCP